MLSRRIQQYAGIGCLLILAACGNNNQQQMAQGPPPAVPVTVTTVTALMQYIMMNIPATVTALNQVDLRPQVSGYITGIYFKDGSRVKKGESYIPSTSNNMRPTTSRLSPIYRCRKPTWKKQRKMPPAIMNWINRMRLPNNWLIMPMPPWPPPKNRWKLPKPISAQCQTSVKYTTIYAPLMELSVYHR